MSEQQGNDGFESFASIARLSRTVVVTEKIDGTNAQVFISDDGQVRAGSRNRWLGLEKTEDAFGFARWAKEHEEELRQLGPGRHFGEWWGAGIQRRYGLTEKRFSLFNVARWSDDPIARDPGEPIPARPACCHVVPVLYRGVFDLASIDGILERLKLGGSIAAPGFMKPEGVVIWHEAARVLFKKTLDGDGHKGQRTPEPRR
jgi:hypothetical protein